ncbi:MAG: protein kinase [Anaerolineae bacterium]|nr:protein kinase [Anaerolineae bacterium]
MLTNGTLLQNRYRIETLLDMGGTGASYRAWDIHHELVVKIKELTPQPDIDGVLLAKQRARFVEEAKILTRLHHRHMVRVMDFFEENGNAYLVIDFVEGESLADLITRRHALPEHDVLAWAEQILNALDYFHHLGGVHRDIKPQNIIIGSDGKATLVDFGTVELWDPRDRRTWAAVEVMGTTAYAPPEQWGLQPGGLDARSDLYSLAATLYHALTGEVPPTAAVRMQDPFKFSPVQALKGHVRPQTQEAIFQAMSLRRERRLRSATDMLEALKYGAPLVSGDAPPARLMLGGRMPKWLQRVLIALGAILWIYIHFFWKKGAAEAPLAYLWDAAIQAAGNVPLWGWILAGAIVIGLLVAVSWVPAWKRRVSSDLYAPPLLPRRSRFGLRIDPQTAMRVAQIAGVVAAVALVVLGVRWLAKSGVSIAVNLGKPSTPATETPVPATATSTATRAPTATPTQAATATPTLTPKPTLTGLPAPVTWTVALNDSFKDNARNWITNIITDDWGIFTRAIADGVYRWDVQAEEPISRWSMPDMESFKNAYVAVDARLVSGPEKSDYGIVLRHSDGNYYLFSARGDGYFRFVLWYGFEWVPKIDWTETLEINPGEVNRLGVVMEGNRFTFFINDVQVAEIEDEQLAEGEAGLSAGVLTSGDAVIEFDNFELRAP